MKKTTLITLFTFIISANLQAQFSCGQSSLYEQLLSKYPYLKTEYDMQQKKDAQTNSMQVQKTQAAPAYTVPVVFHILHMGGAENISDAQVIDQVAILNRDFQKQNADTAIVVPTFTNIIGNVGFAFKLATIDPDGNCTNGIIRHYTPLTNWDANDLSKFDFSWPRNKYMNIYVVRSMNIGAHAYTFLPTQPTPDSADAIVSLHNMVGSIGTSNVSNSRVITHETAHWFNIPHIWGFTNDPGVICGDDGVSDTPITNGFTVCTTGTAAMVCNSNIEENSQNYMDYAPCKIMFTQGQANRMVSSITGSLKERNKIWQPSNLLATGITTTIANCVPKLEVIAMPSRTVCVGQTLTLNSFTCNAATLGYSWTANNGAVISNPTLSSIVVTPLNAGSFTVTCTAIGNGGNASASVILTANSIVSYTNNYSESFENNSIPTNWNVLYPNTSSTSQCDVTSDAASHGTISAYVNAENAFGGVVHILESPSYDFLNNQGAVYSFKCAYARQTPTFKDVIKVQASKDCGGTWKDIIEFSPANLANGSGGVQNDLFIPTLQQWKYVEVTKYPSFRPFLSENSVIFRYYFKVDSIGFGNRIYLDEINFISPVGVNEITKASQLKTWPNPINDRLIIQLHVNEAKKISLNLTDISGREIWTQKEVETRQGMNEIEILDFENIHHGFYTLQINVDGFVMTQKILKN